MASVVVKDDDGKVLGEFNIDQYLAGNVGPASVCNEINSLLDLADEQEINEDDEDEK